MSKNPWEIVEGQQPVAATAIHDGHKLRAEVRVLMALSDAERLREEDPGTAILATVAGTQMTMSRSRFEVDLNRPRETAVYIRPGDAWGLKVWRKHPPRLLVDRSLKLYDAFYADAYRVFREMETRFGRFVVLDVHSYNHRRGGPDAPPDDPEANPEVNVGTGTLDRDRWGSLVDRFIADLSGVNVLGRHLDVRENVRFKGGHFSRWIHESFPESACCLAIEFKKTYMNEWKGKFFAEEHEALSQALAATIPGILESLQVLDGT